MKLQIAQKRKPCFSNRCRAPKPYIGTGIVIAQDRILTCWHMLGNPKNNIVVRHWKAMDLAVIKCNTGDTKPIVIADCLEGLPSRVTVNTMFGKTQGTIHSTRFVGSYEVRGFRFKLGMSGGALQNKDKELIGVICGVASNNRQIATGLEAIKKICKGIGKTKSQLAEPPDLTPVPEKPIPGQGSSSPTPQVPPVSNKVQQARLKTMLPLSDTVAKRGWLKAATRFAVDTGIKKYAMPAAFTALGIGGTGGAGIAAWLALRGGRRLLRRRRDRKKVKEALWGIDIKVPEDKDPKTLKEELEEILGRKTAVGGFPPSTHIPGRAVDELHELLELAGLEGYDPILGASYGLFMQDEITRKLRDASTTDEAKTVIRSLVDSVRDRIDSAAPLVTRSN